MLTPTMPPTVGPLTAMSDLLLRHLLSPMIAPTHVVLYDKLPMPEADREQWCMRLDSLIRSMNELVVIAEPLDHPLRDQLQKRVRDGRALMLSTMALLVLDERANAARAAKPVTCSAFSTVPEVGTPTPVGPARVESENVAAIRIEREQGIKKVEPAPAPAEG